MKKVCSVCKVEKKHDLFYKLKKSKDGLQSRCKLCHKQIENKIKLKPKIFVKQKKCSHCGTVKSRKAFGVENRSKTGLKERCKLCVNTYQKTDEYRDKKRNYKQKEHVKESITRYAQSNLGKDSQRKANLKYRKKISDRAKVYKKVELALKSGKLKKKNCSVCGNHKSQAHHDNYNKPLDVIWLCPIHHKQRHRQLGWGIYHK